MNLGAESSGDHIMPAGKAHVAVTAADRLFEGKQFLKYWIATVKTYAALY